MDVGARGQPLSWLHPERALPAGAIPQPQVSEQSAAVAPGHERVGGSLEAWVMGDAGSMSGEGRQVVWGQGEVGDAGLHADDKVEGGIVASGRAGSECGGGSRRVVTWWGGLHVWHGCGQSERRSDTQSADVKICSLQGQRQMRTDVLEICSA